MKSKEQEKIRLKDLIKERDVLEHQAANMTARKSVFEGNIERQDVRDVQLFIHLLIYTLIVDTVIIQAFTYLHRN